MGKKRAAKSLSASTPVGPVQWLLLTYEPVSLFSLRSTYSMSKGGKTLLLPTPYAVKMALIDAVFRLASPGEAPADARAMFDRIKGRRVRFRPPPECVVQNTFIKIRQDERGAESGLYVPTIAYRELVFFSGSLLIAVDATGWDDRETQLVVEAALHVNYFGKRGSFFQFVSSDLSQNLPEAVTITDGDDAKSIPLGQYGTSQFLDDFGPDLCKAKDGFERISTFHDGKIENGKHRVQVSTLVPYRRVEATRSFTRYTSNPPQSS